MKRGWKRLVFPRREPTIAEKNPARTPPDFAAIHEQLRSSKYVTLQLLWEEYRQANPDGYRYSRFCELYQRWRSKLDVVLRQEHKAGEKMFVDWAGATIPVYDRHTGQAWQAPLFVAALGASSYTWAEATRDQQMESWLRAHVHAFEHFGGIPALAVPDNTKTGVTKAHRYDPDLNPTYYNFALHCGFGIVPARPYKPRDKAKVENAVQVAQRWIVAALRHRKFFSLEELNVAIRELLDQAESPALPQEGRKPRASVWEAIDKPALKPLPDRAVRSERVVARPRQHRLPREPSMPTSTACPTTWCTNWWRSARRRPRSRSCTKARAWHRTCAAAGADRAITNRGASPQEPPRASGMDAFAHGALGGNHRPQHGAAVRADHGRQAAPGDGLSRLPGHHPAGGKVLARNAWKRPRNARCSPARAATKASNRS